MQAIGDAADGDREESGGGRSAAEERRKVVLLVEDHEADRVMYGALLWYNGYTVLHAPDGESALLLAMETPPDVILLDIMLPGKLSGLDVAARLRGVGFEMPMIVLSAVAREDLGSAVERAGITAYLEKPITPFAVVREVLRRVGVATPADG